MKVSIRSDVCIALRLIAAQEHHRKAEDWLNMIPEWERLIEVASQSQALLKMQVAENARLRAENDKLRTALKPFAVIADTYHPNFDDDHLIMDDGSLSLGHLRAAKAALGE